MVGTKDADDPIATAGDVSTRQRFAEGTASCTSTTTSSTSSSGDGQHGPDVMGMSATLLVGLQYRLGDHVAAGRQQGVAGQQAVVAPAQQLVPIGAGGGSGERRGRRAGGDGAQRADGGSVRGQGLGEGVVVGGGGGGGGRSAGGGRHLAAGGSSGEE